MSDDYHDYGRDVEEERERDRDYEIGMARMMADHERDDEEQARRMREG